MRRRELAPRRHPARHRATAVFLLAAGLAGTVQAGDWSFKGKVFADVSRIDKHSAGSTGSTRDDNADLKRLYLTGSYRFDEHWSAVATLDVNWLRNHRDPDLWVKHLYVQRSWSNGTRLRLGVADMPLTMLVSRWYGFRYIDTSVTGLEKLEDQAADWGAHLHGQPAPGWEYAVALVTGVGYKYPSHGDRADVEGYLGYHPSRHTIVAVDGYEGRRAREPEDAIDVTGLHTARRVGLLAGYMDDDWRLGVRYAYVSNWKVVDGGPSTRARSSSVWASRRLAAAWTLFGRYDTTRPDRLGTPDRRDIYANLGLEWKPARTLRLALVAKHRRTSKAGQTLVRSNEFGVWSQLVF